MLNKSKGNMYPDATWNPVKGKCPHDCAYCYMKKWGEQPALHFDASELNTNLGQGNSVFVGSSCDMWADEIHSSWICQTLWHCAKYPKNKYLFQSKNPQRFGDFLEDTPTPLKIKIILGTTIETNRIYPEMGKTPSPKNRVSWMHSVSDKFETMVTVEPIMDFDVSVLRNLILVVRPKWVNIGANTNHSVKLPEPKPEKIEDLILVLNEFTEVKIKNNLKRLYKGG